LVWRALRVRAQILIADDPDSFESFCTSRSLLLLRDLVSHNQVRRTLEQIAALGLIQKMSVPPRGKGDASRYLVAFRAYRQNEVGRINEDTASRDAQSLRTSIFEIDLGL
jgi:type I restriction enzyme S subunit